jgi:hypothetical protein
MYLEEKRKEALGSKVETGKAGGTGVQTPTVTQPLLPGNT